MNTRYCPACGFAHKWQIEKPKICVKCTEDMDTAFAKTVAPQPVQTQLPVARTKAPARRFYDARGNDITDRFAKKQPVRPEPSTDDEDYVDEYEQQALAQELAASISADDFGLSIDEEATGTVKLGSIIQEAVSRQPANTPKKRTRKSK